MIVTKKSVILFLSLFFFTSAFGQMRWYRATVEAPWETRENHTSVVFDGKMWVLGGLDRHHSATYNDVWCSTDGDSWICVREHAPWGPWRYDNASVVFDGKMWVLGGKVFAWKDTNDVWCSTDGDSWICVASAAAWRPRGGHTVVVFKDTLWLLGGRVALSDTIYNDVWFSTDGDSWICATESAGWYARRGHTSVNYNNRLWIMGGSGQNIYNDVWYSTGLNSGAIEETKPLTQSITPTPTIFRSISHLRISQPSILTDISGRRVATFRPGANDIRHLQRGIYFLIPNTPAKLPRKIILIK